MMPYTKIYLKHFDLEPGEYVFCEVSGRPCTEIHHLDGRGKDKDTIENCMALSREYHEMCELSTECNDIAKDIHKSFLTFNPYNNPEKFHNQFFRNNVNRMQEAFKKYKSRK